MVLTKLSWGMAAFTVVCQMLVTVVLVAVFSFHPALVSALPVHNDVGAPVAITYHESEGMASVDWELCDKEQP